MLSTLRAAAYGTVVLGLSACGSIVDRGPEVGAAISSQDLIVVGRLAHQSAEPPDLDSGDLLGHGWFFADFIVRKIEVGDIPKGTVRVRYFGHTYLRDDVNFRFHLRPTGEGDYFVCRPLDSAGYDCD